MSVKRSLPFLFLASLAVALAGGVLMLVQGLTTTALLMLTVGLAGGIGIAVRGGGLGKLGGMDQREVSAAIRARAQKNLEMERGRSPEAR